MTNPLLYNLTFTTPWLSLQGLLDLFLALTSIGFIVYSLVRNRSRAARPAFIFATFACVFYQIPLVLFSPLFYTYLPNAAWFEACIHVAVLFNLGWVYFTPKLNTQRTNDTYTISDLNDNMLWPLALLFFTLLVLYFYRIPPMCTALYALLRDQDVTLLVREIIGKLMGRTYAPHVLNILTSAVGPMVAVLSLGKLYQCALSRNWRLAPIYFCLLAATVLTPLLGGAKGSLVPMAVILAVTGGLVINRWKWRIFYLAAIAIFFISTIMLVKVAQESRSGQGNYAFGSCTVQLGVCDRMKNLMESLHPEQSYYGLTKEKLNNLADKAATACQMPRFQRSASAPSKTITKTDYTPPSLFQHTLGLLYRILANPIQVGAWHYLYVTDYGRPGIWGLSISKLMGDRYVNIPAKVCDIYYAGDKVSTCTAPTSFLFTYPAYLGGIGLALACLATALFDVAGALIIKYSRRTFADLTIGLVTVAVVNLMIADYTTVIISHGAGVAFIILLSICIYHRRTKAK